MVCLLSAALYVEDPKRAVAFECIADFDRLCAMSVPGGAVLLLFRKGGTEDTDGDGRLHLAFSIPASALAQWETWLAGNGASKSKVAKNGIAAATASTSAIRTATYSKPPPPVFG